MELKLTSLHNLAAFPFSLCHSKASAVENLSSDGFLQSLTDEFCASVGILEVGHTGGAPVLHHFADGSDVKVLPRTFFVKERKG